MSSKKTLDPIKHELDVLKLEMDYVKNQVSSLHQRSKNIISLANLHIDKRDLETLQIMQRVDDALRAFTGSVYCTKSIPAKWMEQILLVICLVLTAIGQLGLHNLGIYWINNTINAICFLYFFPRLMEYMKFLLIAKNWQILWLYIRYTSRLLIYQLHKFFFHFLILYYTCEWVYEKTLSITYDLCSENEMCLFISNILVVTINFSLFVFFLRDAMLSTHAKWRYGIGSLIYYFPFWLVLYLVTYNGHIGTNWLKFITMCAIYLFFAVQNYLVTKMYLQENYEIAVN
jgi:hypothetical protein